MKNNEIIVNVKCNLCNELVNNLAGDPSKWGVNLPMVQKDKTIKEVAHHYQCILFRLYPKCNCSKCTGLPSPEDYYEELRKIDSDVFTNMGKTSQKTIDIVQETIEQLDRDYEKEPIQRDELGAINYEIDILLEVWSKELEYDIEVLKRVDKIIAEWYKDVEFVNVALGIPKHKG